MLPRKYHDSELKCGGPQMCSDCRDRLQEQEMKDDSFEILKEETKQVASEIVKSVDREFEKDDSPKKEYWPPVRTFSVNNRLIVEPYVKEGLKPEVKSGFAMVSQKVTVKGLKLLVEAHIRESSEISRALPVGSTIYIREELLHTQPWALKRYEAEGVEGPFMIVDLANVEFVKA